MEVQKWFSTSTTASTLIAFSLFAWAGPSTSLTSEPPTELVVLLKRSSNGIQAELDSVRLVELEQTAGLALRVTGQTVTGFKLALPMGTSAIRAKAAARALREKGNVLWADVAALPNRSAVGDEVVSEIVVKLRDFSSQVQAASGKKLAADMTAAISQRAGVPLRAVRPMGGVPIFLLCRIQPREKEYLRSLMPSSKILALSTPSQSGEHMLTPFRTTLTTRYSGICGTHLLESTFRRFGASSPAPTM